MNISNLMEFSLMDDEEHQFSVPSLAQTPVVKNSILKPSNKDNLIQLSTPVYKNLNVRACNPPLAQTPVVKNSILKLSTKDNLIHLTTPGHKNLKTPMTAHKPTPTRYEQIKELDDQENWAERTTVVLKCDHEEYTKNTQAILHDLIYKVLDSIKGSNEEVPVKEDNSQVTPEAGTSLPMVAEETQNSDDCKTKVDNLSSQGPENVEKVEKETPSSPIIPAKSGACQ